MVTAAAITVISVVTLSTLLAGCAGPAQVLRLEPSATAVAPVWPAPQSEERARYRYLGQLTGEDNLHAPEGGGTDLRTVFNWLVGLVEGEGGRVVLQRPQGGAVDAQGRVLVTDVSRKAVFVFDEAAGRLEVWDDIGRGRRFASPIAVAAGPDGQVLVTDSELGQVFRLDRDGRPLGSFGGGVLRRPTGIARDPARRLVYVADTYAHDIKVFADDGRLLEVIGRRGSGDGEFNYPTHLAFAQDELYVTDTLNSRIQVLRAEAGGPVRKFGERGLYLGNLVRPKGVGVDSEGNVYVIESYYDSLLVFSARGEFLLPIGGTGTATGRFYLPSGVWVDARNRVHIADMFNGRVVLFQFLGGS